MKNIDNYMQMNSEEDVDSRYLCGSSLPLDPSNLPIRS